MMDFYHQHPLHQQDLNNQSNRNWREWKVDQFSQLARKNPVKFLKRVSQERLEMAAKDSSFVKEYEKEILKLKAQGFTKREIGEKYGFTYEQIHNFISRYNQNQRKLAAGIALKRKGRPPKDYVVSEQDKVAELKYILARKDDKIKRLEMENELMRDFLSLTERK